MRFDLLTIFPDFFTGPLDYGVVARARAAGRLEIAVHNLRDWAPPPHRITDDRPFGGGEGMVMKPEPIFGCLHSLLGRTPGPAPAGAAEHVILLSAQGRLFLQADARRYAACPRLILICGRYEGVDERVAAHMVDEELCLGDFVLSGGELAAAAVLDATARLLPGVLGDEQSAINESFAAAAPHRLDCPHYTRPVEFHGWEVPELLRQGNHAAIARWRRQQALAKTRTLRPDLYSQLGSDR
ncbi:MAG: tRNA (guanosine(37)-N1)-methyltransferase TrmD [Terriglobales bacterium]